MNETIQLKNETKYTFRTSRGCSTIRSLRPPTTAAVGQQVNYAHSEVRFEGLKTLEPPLSTRKGNKIGYRTSLAMTIKKPVEYIRAKVLDSTKPQT